MKQSRTVLTGFLILCAAALSFDALRGRALDSGVIHGTLLYGLVSEHMLAGAWAGVIDALVWVGILGVRADRADPRAWSAMIVGLTFTLGFQVFALPASVARAVPPLALAVAIVVFEAPRTRRAPVGERAQNVPPPVRETVRPPAATSHALTARDREAVRRAVRAGRDPATVTAQRGLDPDTVARLLAKWDADRLAASNGHDPREVAA